MTWFASFGRIQLITFSELVGAPKNRSNLSVTFFSKKQSVLFHHLDLKWEFEIIKQFQINVS